MLQGDKNKPYYNASGYPDPTASKAIKSVKNEDALENKVGFLIKILKYIIR